jgi:hypothetical protein
MAAARCIKAKEVSGAVGKAGRARADPAAGTVQSAEDQAQGTKPEHVGLTF